MYTISPVTFIPNTKSTQSKSKDPTPKSTFSLTTTINQRIARDAVVLPHTTVISNDTATGITLKQSFYSDDDDFDEDDPDADLEF